jgi:PsbP-like protein/Short C-terminal domain
MIDMLFKRHSMRNTYYVTIVLVLLFASFLSYPTIFLTQNHTAVAQSITEPSNNFNTYQNSTYGIKMQYPANWQITEGRSLQRFVPNDTQFVIAEFHPPDLSVSVVVGIEKLLKNITLDKYIEESTASLKKNQPGAQITEQNRTTLAGLPAYELVLIGPFDYKGFAKRFGLDVLMGDLLPDQPINSTSMMIFTIRGDNAYFIGYGDAAGKLSTIVSDELGIPLPGAENPPSAGDPFSHYLPVVEGMIDSIELRASNIIPQQNGQQNVTNEDPMSILDQRLARGEITIEEYERLRGILER